MTDVLAYLVGIGGPLPLCQPQVSKILPRVCFCSDVLARVAENFFRLFVKNWQLTI